MDTAILIDSDREHAQQLMRHLRSRHLNVTPCTTIRDAALLLRKHPFDVLILVPDTAGSWRVAAHRLDQAADLTSNAPLRLCFLRVPNRGPNERLAGAKQGWRVLYENQ